MKEYVCNNCIAERVQCLVLLSVQVSTPFSILQVAMSLLLQATEAKANVLCDMTSIDNYNRCHCHYWIHYCHY